MSQLFVNFVDGAPYQHGVGHIQTKRVAFTSSGSAQTISLTWDVPFADANYTVAFQIEGSIAGENVEITSGWTFQKSATGITVSVTVFSGAISCVLHATAIHD